MDERFDYLDKRIQNGEFQKLRQSLGNIIYACRDFSDGEFDDAVKYVESKGIKIKDDELKGELVSIGKETYTDDDFAVAIVHLQRNFCDERIAEVKKIGKALYSSKPAPQKEPTKQTQTSSAQTPQSSAKPEGVPRPKAVRHQFRKWILAAALLVAVIVIIAIALQIGNNSN